MQLLGLVPVVAALGVERPADEERGASDGQEQQAEEGGGAERGHAEQRAARASTPAQIDALEQEVK